MKEIEYSSCAIATDINGNVIRFALDDYWVLADDMELVTLVVPNCITRIDCLYNHLTHLHIHEGVLKVECEGNNIKELKLPNSLRLLSCDKDLFNYDECKVEMVDIYY